jgi:hypothetical protein
MSENTDTPISDKACRWAMDVNGSNEVVDIDIARDLERQLAEARAENKRLERWKKEALFVEKAWNPQEVGNLLGMPLAADIRANIQPRVRRLIEQRDRLAEAIKAATVLVAAKGRHNTFLAYQGLTEALAALNQPETKP